MKEYLVPITYLCSVSICVIGMLSCTLWAGPQVGHGEQELLTKKWPQGGPLLLKFRTDPAKVSRKEAEELARLCLQVPRDHSLHLAPAFLTDNDFPILAPKDMPVWLVEARNYPLRSAKKAAKDAVLLPVLYLAIDAERGRLVEAFTPPKNAWWEKMASGKGKEHSKYFQDTGRVITWPEKPAPKTSLQEVLRWLTPDYPASQVIVRYATYSNQATGSVVVERIDGLSIVPKTLQQDVWMVFSEGLEFYPSVPFDPTEGRGRRRPVVIYGRSAVILDATTGAVLSHEDYGDVAK